MLYSKKNYALMGASVLLILVGFLLMAGGKSTDPTAFSAKIFSTQRIVVAPIICVLGFVLMIYAILAGGTRGNHQKGGEDAA